MAIALALISFALFASGCVNQASAEQANYANFSSTSTTAPSGSGATGIHNSISGTVKRSLANAVDVVLHRRG